MEDQPSSIIEIPSYTQKQLEVMNDNEIARLMRPDEWKAAIKTANRLRRGKALADCWSLWTRPIQPIQTIDQLAEIDDDHIDSLWPKDGLQKEWARTLRSRAQKWVEDHNPNNSNLIFFPGRDNLGSA